jgi:ribonuclease HII
MMPPPPPLHRRSARLQGQPPSTSTTALPQKRTISNGSNSTSTNNDDDYSSMKVVELRDMLKKRGLPVSGIKSDLIERLVSSSSSSDVPTATTATSNNKPKKRVKAATTTTTTTSKSSSDSYCLPRTREHQLKSKQSSSSLTVIGVDEAGRGPLAGPVVAAAVIVPTSISGIIDSKQITKEEERERLYELLIASPNIRYAVAIVSAQRIDEINILQATLEGMRMAVEGVLGIRKTSNGNSGDDKANVASAKRTEVSYIVTGGNEVEEATNNNNTDDTSSYHALIDGNKIPKEMPCESESVIKGDGKEYSIGAASILAKVTRDRLMHEYDKLYPEYNLRQHKGYPTAAHMSAVRKFGASPIHRRTFAPLKHWEFDTNGKIIGNKKS